MMVKEDKGLCAYTAYQKKGLYVYTHMRKDYMYYTHVCIGMCLNNNIYIAKNSLGKKHLNYRNIRYNN